MNERLWALATVLALTGAPASAATACRFTSAGALSFGAYDVFSPLPRDSQANLNVTCDRDGGPGTVNVTVTLGGASPAARSLTAPGLPSVLNYALYRDNARTLVWGNTAGTNASTQVVSIPNRGSATLVFTVYGRIPAGQNARAGTYSDAVLATVIP